MSAKFRENRTKTIGGVAIFKKKYDDIKTSTMDTISQPQT